jgi:WS/DGAT/MGAT family acyltransferase
MRQLTSVDAQFVAAEDGRVHGHVTGVAIYDPTAAPKRRLTVEDVREIVAGRIHLVPPFRSRQVKVPFGLDLPYWIEDPDFDIDNHVHGHVLAEPGDDRALADFVARIMSKPLDLARPPWAIHVIQGLAGGRVAVATQIHHSAADGLAMAEVFAILHGRGSDRGDAAAKPAPRPERVPTSAEMLIRGLAGLPRQPIRFLRGFPRALPHLDQVVTLRALPGVRDISALGRRAARLGPDNPDGEMLPEREALAPRTRTTNHISGERTAAFTSTSLPEVKAVKSHFGVTVNDVVMAIIAGGLRAWLVEQHDLPDRPLAAMVPVSVRAPEQGGAFGNRIAMMIPPVCTDEPDPERRLRLTHEAMRSAKERHRAVPATLLQDANHFIPPVLLARAARATALVASRRSGAAANLLISNIPGARERQHLGEARLEAHYPLSAIFHGMGLNITVVSYCDQLDWGIAGDPEQVDDVWGLGDSIRAAQAELLALVPAPKTEPEWARRSISA